jgi:hypothetical protein
VAQADVPSVQRDASLATGQPESDWAVIAAPLRAAATEAVGAKWTMAGAAGVNETGVGNMTAFTERGLVGETAALDQGVAGDAGVIGEPAAFGEMTVLLERGVAADATVFGEARSTGLAAGQRGHEQSFLAGYLPTAPGDFGGTGGGAHGAENAATALGFEPVAPWGVGLGPRQVEFEIAPPWPTSLPGAPAPGPGDSGAVELPLATASSGGLGISTSGQGGSVVPNLAPLDLLASWRALWLLAMVHPSDICLPGLAPSG